MEWTPETYCIGSNRQSHLSNIIFFDSELATKVENLIYITPHWTWKKRLRQSGVQLVSKNCCEPVRYACDRLCRMRNFALPN